VNFILHFKHPGLSLSGTLIGGISKAKMKKKRRKLKNDQENYDV
jgi:hypothetical protein